MTNRNEDLQANIFTTPIQSSISTVMTATTVAGSGATILGSELGKIGNKIGGTPLEIPAAMTGAGIGAGLGFFLGSVVGAFSGQPAVDYYLRGIIPNSAAMPSTNLTTISSQLQSITNEMLRNLPDGDDQSSEG